MSYYPDKAKIGVPNKLYKHHFNNFHESTTGFMVPNVPFIKRFTAKSKINFEYDDFCRLNPMPIPTMGQANINLRWYFVPIRIIFSRWNEFMTNSAVYGLAGDNMKVTITPHFNLKDVMDQVTRQTGTYVIAEVFKDSHDNPIVITANNWSQYFGYNPTEPADFIYNGNPYKLTNLGIQIYTIWKQLGYDFNGNDVTISALPLLAFCKVMLDHYIPRYWWGYMNDFSNLYQILDNIDPFEDCELNPTLWWYEFIKLCTTCCYNDDYFTTAWSDIGGPNNDSGSIDMLMPSNIDTIDDKYGTGRLQNVATLHAELVADDTIQFSQQDLNTLKAVDVYLKKNQIAGTKYWDRLLAHFGVSTNKALIKVAECIDEIQIPIRFNEVTSTAETLDDKLGDNLGSYAGQGIGYIENAAHFNYSAEEEGFIICIKTIVPDIAYCNGMDAEVFKLDRFDFYNEEFDAMGTEPINSLELYAGYDKLMTQNESSIFGFTPRYSWYKMSLSKVSGKMSIPHLKNEMDPWNFTRWFRMNSFTLNSNQILVQTTPKFNIGYGDGIDIGRDTDYAATQYDRIFYSPQEHNFNTYSLFNFDILSTLKPLYAYDDLIDDNDKAIKMDIGNKND